VVLGSKSTLLRGNLGGIKGRVLHKGDVICSKPPHKPHHMRFDLPELDAFIQKDLTEPIRVIMGPQKDYFDGENKEIFLRSTYTVSRKSDRTGLRLQGRHIFTKGETDIVSDGLPPGSVQVLPSGELVVLFKDRQIGGYPKIAVVISADLRRLAQARPGETIRFAAVSLQEAHKEYMKLRFSITQVMANMESMT
jgi:allophanate hydrolase subunit 2